MKTELFIIVDNETYNVSLYDDITIPLTFNIADIADITSKNGSYSKTINIPGDNTNNKLFKFIYQISTTGAFIMNKAIKCFILSDTLTIFEGNFQLTKVNIKRGEIVDYEANVYSESIGFFNAISDKLLRGNADSDDDLDFSELDHQMTFNFVKNSKYSTSGITYKAINKQGREDAAYANPRSWYVDELTPCLFIKDIWDKIFEKAGFTYESSFINGSEFGALLYPFTDRYLLQDEDEAAKNDFTLEGGPRFTKDCLFADDPINVSKYTDGKLSPSSPWYVTEVIDGGPNWALGEMGTNNPVNLTTGKFNVPVSGVYDINYSESFDVYLNVAASFPSPWTLNTSSYLLSSTRTIIEITGQVIRVHNGVEEVLDTVVINNGITYVSSEAIQPGIVLPATISMNASVSNLSRSTEPILENANISFNLASITLAEDDELFIRKTLKMPFTGQTTFWNPSTQTGTWLWKNGSTPVLTGVALSTYESDAYVHTNSFSGEMGLALLEGNYVEATKILHNDITQADFIKSIIKMFNLYVEPLGNNKLLIETRDVYYTSDSIDWSDKVDYSEDIEIARISDIPDKVVVMRYDYDGTVLEDEYKESQDLEYGQYYKRFQNNVSSNDILEFKPIFAPAPQSTLYSSLIETPVLYKKKDEVIDPTAKLKPRILFNNTNAFTNETQSLAERFVWMSRLGTPPSISYRYPYTGHWQYPTSMTDYIATLSTNQIRDLSFDVNPNKYFVNDGWISNRNLFNTYYYDMITELTDDDARMVTMSLILNQNDISNFSFRTNIFIDGNYYRVNKISDWVPDQPTRVELLTTKIEKLVYDKPFVIKPKPPFHPWEPRPYTRKNEVYIDVIDEGLVEDGIKRNTLINVDLIDGNKDVRGDFFVDVIDTNDFYGDKRVFSLSTIEMATGVQTSTKVNTVPPYIEQLVDDGLYFADGYITDYYVL